MSPRVEACPFSGGFIRNVVRMLGLLSLGRHHDSRVSIPISVVSAGYGPIVCWMCLSVVLVKPGFIKIIVVVLWLRLMLRTQA